MRVFANVLGRVKCPEGRQSAGGRLPWRASREEEGQVQAPRRVRRKGPAEGWRSRGRLLLGGEEGLPHASAWALRAQQGTAGWEGRARAWLGFNSHSSAKGGLPGGSGAGYWSSAAVAVSLPTRTRVCSEKVTARGLSLGAERGRHPGSRSVFLLLWTRICGLCPSSLGFSRT